jgi:hypothetical protein
MLKIKNKNKKKSYLLDKNINNYQSNTTINNINNNNY